MARPFGVWMLEEQASSSRTRVSHNDVWAIVLEHSQQANQFFLLSSGVLKQFHKRLDPERFDMLSSGDERKDMAQGLPQT